MFGYKILRMVERAIAQAQRITTSPFERAKLHFVRDVLLPRAPRLIEMKVSAEFDKKFYALVRQGFWPVIYSNHQGHPDALGIAEVAEYLTHAMRGAGFARRFNGVKLLVAASIKAGHQGETLRFLYEATEEQVKPKGLTFAGIVRKTDEEKYKMKSSLGDLRTIIKAYQEGFGIATFPEATVEGGRPKDDDLEDIRGMQKIQPETLIGIDELLRRHGALGALFITVGLHGGYRLLNPITHKPNHLAILGALGLPIKCMSVVVDAPLIKAEIPKNQNPEDFLMRQVAKLLPPHARGAYAAAAT